nr:MAG TPA: hypothetical protein [Bacteriophage sp.]
MHSQLPLVCRTAGHEQPLFCSIMPKIVLYGNNHIKQNKVQPII